MLMQRLRSVLKLAASRYPVVSFKSLALWRMLFGATCLQVVLRRWSMLEVFYAPSGAYPVAALNDQVGWTTGPLRWLTSVPALHAAFALCFLVTLAFTLGLWTRVVKWLLLPVLFSVHARTPVILTGGEMVLHLQALGCWFFPLGRVLSLDAWLAQRAGRHRQARGNSTALWTLAYPLLLLQLSVIYFFSMVAKYGVTWQDGTAVARALGSATVVTDLGAWFARAPDWMLRAATTGTLIVEGALPLFLLSPWYRRQAHGFAAILMISLHGGIWLTMEVGSFSQAMLCQVPLLWHARGAEDVVEIPPTRSRRWQALAVVALVYLMAARLSHDLVVFPKRPKLPLPEAILRVTRTLHLSQGWQMFSPDPPDRDYVIVTDAVTARGRHFDPWRRVASDISTPLAQFPTSVAHEHAFTRYENTLSTGAHAKMHRFFASWVLRQQHEGDPVERFDAWLMVLPTDPKRVVPADQLDALVGVFPLPLTDPLPIAKVDARGIWAPERALDRKLVPEGTDVLTPVSAAMSGGCPTLTLDLGQAKPVRSVFLQADAADRLLIEGSLDGQTFRQLAAMTSLDARQHKSRVVELSGERVQYVRLRPVRSRGFRHLLSEVALFERLVSLPDLPSRPSETFISSHARPTVVGIISGTNQPSPDCPAENPATYRAAATGM